jgi:DNA mismatch repair protein MutS
MIEQYLAVKEQYKDCILFYRLGDFYEMFFDDAVIASKVLELVLTKKACGNDQKAPMCGVPYHAVENYIAKMVDHGYKVAIAEQMTDPALSKGIVEREVIRVITPGTLVQESMLSEKDNNYLVSVYMDNEGVGLAYTDISTGEFCALQFDTGDNDTVLLEELTRIQPREIICNLASDEAKALWQYASEQDIFISKGGERYFGHSACAKAIQDHYKTSYEKSAGLASEDVPLLFYSVGALLSYLKDTQKQDLEHLSDLAIKDIRGCMLLDRATIRNLEITESLYHKRSQ